MWHAGQANEVRQQSENLRASYAWDCETSPMLKQETEFCRGTEHIREYQTQLTSKLLELRVLLVNTALWVAPDNIRRGSRLRTSCKCFGDALHQNENKLLRGWVKAKSWSIGIESGFGHLVPCVFRWWPQKPSLNPSTSRSPSRPRSLHCDALCYPIDSLALFHRPDSIAAILGLMFIRFSFALTELLPFQAPHSAWSLHQCCNLLLLLLLPLWPPCSISPIYSI